VNRQKTKKWANAAPANYGGDDWGDDDEYDPPPPPVSKPTGLRQQGQALPGTPRDSPTVDKKYGDLPPLPGAASNPRARANSFDEDDEKRDFSSATLRQPSPPVAAAPDQGPATRFSQITGVPTVRNPSGPPALSISTQQPSQAPVGLRKAKDIVSPVSVSSGSPHPDILKPGRVNASETSSVVSPASDTKTPSSIDYQARRDFSPSAVPQPLSTRASPAPQSASAAEVPSQRFPARKESLSQSAGPPLSDIMQGAPQDGPPKPWTAPVQSSSPGAATRSPIAPPAGKPLPFVRPADIYRRNQEEQERQRQSMESSRPSMDSITGAKSSERSDSPAKSQPRASFEDSSDSGRRLMPILEPVNERKSEYGFGGYNANARKEPEPIYEPETALDHQEVSDSDKLDVEEVRRQSTSPKLPDLARLSGFGMDLFSQSKPEVPEPSIGTEVIPTNAQLSSSSPEDPTLRNQSSFSFRSVVHQAFDRTDDSSVPATPASRTGSTVRRTDSESTGTDGISPIMSRVPSAANPISRRDVSTASKLEVVTEPISPEETAQSTPKDESHPEDVRDREVPGFKPGHRRDISTPSPGNSPARTPDLAQPKTFPSGQQAVVAETTTEVSPDDDEPLQLPRPIAEREQSFRPALPGGWTSFATTARSETPTQAPLEDIRSSDAEVSPVHDEGEEFDFTPTTTKHVLRHTDRGVVVAGAALGGATGAALGSHDRDNEAGNKDLPTPDLSMAPGGNLYSTTSPDPRLIPNLEQAPPETQLRPDPYRTESDESREAPTPLPKDSPNASAEAIRSGGHPNVGTDTHDYDAENDKLQKEIVKSLTPRASDAGRVEEPQLEDETTHHQGHESSYLPDYYWSSNNDEQEPVPSVPETIEEAEVPEVQTKDLPESPTIAPLSPRRTNQSLQTPRPPLANRFSWEKSSEDVSLQPPVEEATKVPATESRAPPTTFDIILSEPVVPARDEGPPKTSPLHSPANTTESHLGRDTAIVAGGVAAVGVAAAAAHNQQPQGPSERRLSLAEEKSLATEFGYPVSPTPPEDEHPARSPQPYLSPTTGEPAHPPVPSTVSPTSPLKQQFSPTTTRLLAFKEIVAMTSPHQRIQTFDETRHRFAAMDSGLNDWMSKLQAQYPEHANASGSWGGARMSVTNGTARSKFSKAAGGGAPPLQQPYYQQYLNASSPSTPSTPTGKPSASQSFPAAGSQQGFSPAGGKSTGHQVQAKGKEFFHTAGVFGGKAGKAGKGLLAKGKNKLRGAGGDKVD
jgi:hypothetical protein